MKFESLSLIIQKIIAIESKLKKMLLRLFLRGYHEIS